MLRERVVNRINDRDILIRGHRCFHVGNEMGRVVVTGLGEMHLVAAPVGPRFSLYRESRSYGEAIITDEGGQSLMSRHFTSSASL